MPPSRHRRRQAASREQRRTQPAAIGGGFNSLWLRISYAAIAVIFIAALLISVVIYLLLYLLGGGTGSADGYVEGIGEQLDVADSREHFPDTISISAVNPDGYTVPPTSGRHWNGWVSCGFYTDPVPDERIVHNMEHGNIIVHYNLPDAAQVAELRDAYDAIGQTTAWGVARPYDRIPAGTVALTTWGVRDGPMNGVDQGRIERFFEAYSGKLGPEFPNGAPCTQGGVMSP